MRNSDAQMTTIYDRCIYEDYLVFAKSQEFLNYINGEEMI